MQPITAWAGLIAEAQATPRFAQPRRQLRQNLGTVLENPELADLAAAATLRNRHSDRRLVHIQPDISDSIHQARLPRMRLWCRSSGTTLDILHAERRAADHSANIRSRGRRFEIPVPPGQWGELRSLENVLASAERPGVEAGGGTRAPVCCRLDMFRGRCVGLISNFLLPPSPRLTARSPEPRRGGASETGSPVTPSSSSESPANCARQRCGRSGARSP